MCLVVYKFVSFPKYYTDYIDNAIISVSHHCIVVKCYGVCYCV